MGADPGQAAFAFLALTEGHFDGPAEFFPLPPALLVRICSSPLQRPDRWRKASGS
jgi:hypothetical protein